MFVIALWFLHENKKGEPHYLTKSYLYLVHPHSAGCIETGLDAPKVRLTAEKAKPLP